MKKGFLNRVKVNTDESELQCSRCIPYSSTVAQSPYPKSSSPTADSFNPPSRVPYSDSSSSANASVQKTNPGLSSNISAVIDKSITQCEAAKAEKPSSIFTPNPSLTPEQAARLACLYIDHKQKHPNVDRTPAITHKAKRNSVVAKNYATSQRTLHDQAYIQARAARTETGIVINAVPRRNTRKPHTTVGPAPMRSSSSREESHNTD